MKTTIKIKDFLYKNRGICTNEGERLYHAICLHLEENNEIALDFSDVTLLTTSFLQAAIGQLYYAFDEKKLEKKLCCVQISPKIESRLKGIIGTCKIHLHHPDSFNESAKKILNGE